MLEFEDDGDYLPVQEINYWNQRLSFWVNSAQTYNEAYDRAMQCYEKTKDTFWLERANNLAEGLSNSLDSIDRVEDNLNWYEAEWRFS